MPADLLARKLSRPSDMVDADATYWARRLAYWRQEEIAATELGDQGGAKIYRDAQIALKEAMPKWAQRRSYENEHPSSQRQTIDNGRASQDTRAHGSPEYVIRP